MALRQALIDTEKGIIETQARIRRREFTPHGKKLSAVELKILNYQPVTET